MRQNLHSVSIHGPQPPRSVPGRPRSRPCPALRRPLLLTEMSHTEPIRLVDSRGRKYLTTDERARFLQAAARARQPADQTFALTLAHTGARISEILALRAQDVDLDAGTVRIRTLKRRAEHWREIPVPPELLRASSSSIRSDRWAPGAPQSHSGRFPAPPPTGASPQS